MVVQENKKTIKNNKQADLVVVVCCSSNNNHQSEPSPSSQKVPCVDMESTRAPLWKVQKVHRYRFYLYSCAEEDQIDTIIRYGDET